MCSDHDGPQSMERAVVLCRDVNFFLCLDVEQTTLEGMIVFAVIPIPAPAAMVAP